MEACRNDPAKWAQFLYDHVKDYDRSESTEVSAARLKLLVQSKWLLYEDMKDHPERFFKAHRLLGGLMQSGFGIRFTAQYNLFIGSVLALGGADQVAMLPEYQEKGTLGCFALTEVSAGVNSGLIVETTATWDDSTQEFILNTPNPGAAKNWISQGKEAELAVVFANLIIGEKNWRLHAFLVPLKTSDGSTTPSVIIEEMGRKTVANDLDNVRLSFNNLRLPKSSMLSKYCDIENGEYKIKGERLRIEIIGSRLLTGRLCIAQAACVWARNLMGQTRDYTLQKDVHILGGTTKLGLLPQLQSIYSDGDALLDKMEKFSAMVERKLVKYLKTGGVPDQPTVEAISVCKIRVVQAAVELTHRLQQEVGSYALMEGTGFEDVDMLLCCKFAEGDTRILLQKIARDKLMSLIKANPAVAVGRVVSDLASWNHQAEMAKTLKLATSMMMAKSQADGWNNNLEAIFDLANTICDRHLATCTSQHMFD